MAQTVRAGLTLDARTATALLAGLERNANNIGEQLDIIARGAQQWERDLIGSEGAIAHQPWPKDLQITMALKRSKRTMVETGRLVDMLLGTPKRTSTTVKVTAPGYALFQQVGTKRQHRRNIMGIPPHERIVPVITELLEAMLRVSAGDVAVPKE